MIVFQRKERLMSLSTNQVKGSLSDLSNLEKSVINMSPQNVLKRGYSITKVNGKSVKHFSETKIGDTLETIVFEGSIVSTVKSSNPLK
jgi:exodeoxyribonuclease VII large subunit